MIKVQRLNGTIQKDKTLTYHIKGKIQTGIMKVYPELEDIIIIPTDDEQKLKSEKYGYNEITVEPMDITNTSYYKKCLTISNKILGGVDE